MELPSHEIFNLFGLTITIGHIALAGLIAYFARVTSRDKRYLASYQQLLQEHKFSQDQEIKILKIQNQYLTESFKIILDEKPENLRERVKARFDEISKSITDFPLHVEKSFVKRTPIPKAPKSFFKFLRDFIKGKNLNGETG